MTGSISSTLNSTFNGVTIGIGSGSNISNIGIGSASLGTNTGTSNVGIGPGTLQLNRAASNVAIGTGALGFQTFTGNGFNTSIGAGTLGILGSGSAALGAQLNQNTIVGASTGQSMIVGARNTIMGASAFQGADNVERLTGIGRGVFSAIGGASGSAASGSKYNTAIGHNAFFSFTSGSNNVSINGGGINGEGIVSGSNNNIIGMDSGLPPSMEGNTIIGRGITGISSTPLTNNVIIADGKGNIALQKNGATASVLIPSSVSVTGAITASGDASITGAVTASVFLATSQNGSAPGAFAIRASSSGSIPNTWNTSLGKDFLDIYQYQGQPYAFNLHLTSDQLNIYSGSQFAFQLQTNGSGQSQFGGATYYALASGSYTSSVGGGSQIPGLNIVGNNNGGFEINDFKAPSVFEKNVYIQQGLYVSQSTGGRPALTINGGGGNSLLVTGSVEITNGSLKVSSINTSVSITGSLSIDPNGEIKLGSGSNTQTGTFVLDGGNPGTATISNNKVSSNSLIFLTKQTNTNSGNGTVSVTSKGSGTFSVTSDHNGDADTVAYMIINPS